MSPSSWRGLTEQSGFVSADSCGDGGRPCAGGGIGEGALRTAQWRRVMNQTWKGQHHGIMGALIPLV